MDHAQFQEAQRAYDSGDYRVAAKGFLAAAGKGSAGNGGAYHMAGNALMKLRRHADAITVYGHALRDDAYTKRGTIRANLGAAYSAMGEYADAVREYEAALAEPDYDSPYKAWQGIAKAFMERSHVDEAAVAYRKAALDETNPDPGKALLNLGLCFMALGRPQDAVEAYKAALGFDSYQGRGKALCNLGQALTAMGEYEEAVRSFEKAVQMHGHRMSPAARNTYDVAVQQCGAKAMPGLESVASVAAPTPVPATADCAATDPVPTPFADAAPMREPASTPVPATPMTVVAASASYSSQVEGWESGEMPAALADVPPGGWETTELQALMGDAPGTVPGGEEAASALGFGDEEAVSDFFNRTEEQMKDRAREERKEERRAKRASGGTVKSVIGFVVFVLVLAAALAAAYWFGFGWPTQSNTVAGMLDAYSAGRSVEEYWVAVPSKDVEKAMAPIPPSVKDFVIGGIERGPQISKVSVTVSPEKGSAMRYVITMSREGVGWKVSGVENDFSSIDGK